MKIEELKILTAVFHELNLTRVAERYHLSQSNLSKLIRRAEDELGFRLFERKGFKGLRPTLQGARLAGRLQSFSRSWEDTVALVKNLENERLDVKITGPGLYMRNIFLPAWFASPLAESHRLTYVQSRIDQISMIAQASDLDLVVTNSPFELLDWVPVPVFTERFAVFSSEPRAKSLADLDLRDRHWLAYRAANEVLSKFFHENRISPRQISAYIDDVESILDVISTRPELLAVLPAHAAHTHPRLKCFPLKQNTGQTLVLMYRTENESMQALVKKLKKMLE